MCSHEEALKAAPLVPNWSDDSCSIPSIDLPFAVTPQASIHSRMNARGLEGHNAELQAAKALDMFSPDERNTRVDEFWTLVSSDQ